jgi:HTH-type transcriptional regulator/antitoxin HigA
LPCSLYHELGHILLHDKRRTFLEDGDNDPETRQQEVEADHFAGDTLIPAGEYTLFIEQGDFSEKAINAFASRVAIAPEVFFSNRRLCSNPVLEVPCILISILLEN